MRILVFGAIGAAILAVSTAGFAASLSTTPSFNLIGASDNNTVNTARGNLTEIIWNEAISGEGVIEMDQIIFTVGNEDPSTAHIFQVCAIMEGPVAIFSPAAGELPACVNTSSIAASGKLTGQIISFANPVDVASIIDFSFSIEELT